MGSRGQGWMNASLLERVTALRDPPSHPGRVILNRLFLPEALGLVNRVLI